MALSPHLSLLSHIFFIFVSVVALVQATYIPSGAICEDYNTSLHTSVSAFNFTAPQWSDNYQLMDFNSIGGSRPDAGAFPAPVNGTFEYDDSVTISGTFCTPKTPGYLGREKTVLLATHGIGFDRSYWNIPQNVSEYNFAQYAISEGYSIFFYDRLGLGQSTRMSGFINQASIQVDILRQLSSLVRTGALTAGNIGAPKSVVLLGHSFGSFLSSALLGIDPSAADAAVLTGLAYVGQTDHYAVTLEAMNPRIASTQNVAAWAGLDAGYLTWVDVFANVINFFKAPAYTLDTAVYAESTKQPFAVMELLSLLALNYSAPDYAGPVLFLSGEFDFIVCGGYCPGVLEAGKQYFPAAKPFATYAQPGAGHGLNYHVNATGAFKVALDFLGENGF